jgi:hypothetical protein
MDEQSEAELDPEAIVVAPPGQATHAEDEVDPDSGLYVSAGHGVHQSTEEEAEYEPGAHGSQPSSASLGSEPAAQTFKQATQNSTSSPPSAAAIVAEAEES